MGQNVTIRSMCTTCGGSGRIFVPDPPIRRPKPSGGGGGGDWVKPGVPWGFKKKKQKPDDDIGIIQMDPEAEFEVPPTLEQQGRTAARALGFMAFVSVAIYVGWLGSLWTSLVPPSVAGLVVWLVLRRRPLTALRIGQFAVLGLSAWAAYYLASAFGLIGAGPTP